MGKQEFRIVKLIRACSVELSADLPDIFLHLICLFWVLTSFFHLTSFYWMFLEGKLHSSVIHVVFAVPGLYLFLQVQFPLSLTSIKYKHFLIFGWGEGQTFLNRYINPLLYQNQVFQLWTFCCGLVWEYYITKQTTTQQAFPSIFVLSLRRVILTMCTRRHLLSFFAATLSSSSG